MSAEKPVQEEIIPFGIQIDHPTNSDVLIQSIPGLRLRSLLKVRPVRDRRTGNMLIPRDQAAALGSLPEVPGMEIHINVDDGIALIRDPLTKQPMMCERIAGYINERTGKSNRISGVPDKPYKLDVDSIKTLAREMVRLVASGEAVRVKGAMPTEEQLEKLPGKYLLNPGSRVPNTQPRYEEDWDTWVQNLTKAGG
jgi:hypothetical protein